MFCLSDAKLHALHMFQCDSVYNTFELKAVYTCCLQLDIVATFEIDEEALQSTVEANEDYNCSSSGGASRGVLGPFGILVLADEPLSELTPVYFYISKGTDGIAKTHFCADQSRFAPSVF